MEYLKPFISLEDQADRLLGKGMSANRDDLITHLRDAGYYRLSGYWYIFKNRDAGRFVEGTSFERVWNLYVFDRQFRLIVLDAVERVEVYVRSQLANLLAEDSGPFGFLDNANLPRMNEKRYTDFISRCKRAYQRSREPFAIHFNKKYGDGHKLPPYWMLVNLMDFGMAVSLYKGAPVEVRQAISDELEVSTTVLDSWLVTINTIRNICAHHGRLWNRTIGTPPAIPRKDARWHEPVEVSNKKIFGSLTVLSYILSYIAPNTSWRVRLLSQVERLPEEDQERMGFVEGWKDCPIWGQYLDDEAAAKARSMMEIPELR